jgi:hypothetical protein
MFKLLPDAHPHVLGLVPDVIYMLFYPIILQAMCVFLFHGLIIEKIIRISS